MGTLLLLTSALQPSAEVLPALSLLGHQVKILPSEGSALLEAPDADLLLVDGRQELAHARDLCRLIRTTGTDVPVLLVVTEGGLSVVTHDWGMDDVVLHTCGPAELEARIKLAIGRLNAQREADDPESHVIRSGEVVVDDVTYTAKIGGRPLDLTFKEFELLKHLAQHPGRVFSRQQLLQEVWGYDYFGGTRTVDVHVRRLRAKLGPENETLIGTVRNVGYRFVLPADAPGRAGHRRRARRPGRLSASQRQEKPVRAVVQRVTSASVQVAGETVGAIDVPGLLVYLGVTHADGTDEVEWMARKVWSVRLLRDEQSASDIDAPILVVSQFTLYGDARKGRRPTWEAAAPASVSEPVYDAFCTALERLGAHVERGAFGADMQVACVNDGPITLILEK